MIDRVTGQCRKIHDAKEAAGNLRVLFVHPENPHEIVVQQGDDVIQIVSSGAKPRTIDRTELRRVTAIYQQQRATARAAQRDSRERLRTLLPAHELDLRRDRPDSGDRALYLAQSVADPGGFIVHEPASNRVWDFLRRSTTDSGQRALRTENFVFPSDDGGAPASGLLVFPVDPRIRRAPLVIWMADLPGRTADRRYRPEVQALAEFGFAVAVIDETKTFGADRDALAAHLARTIDLLAEHYPVSRRSVALAGKRSGAARALSIATRPARSYRAVVAVLPEPVTGHDHSESPQLLSPQDLVASSRVSDCAFFVCSWPGPPQRPLPLPSHSAALGAAELLRRCGAMVELRKESDDVRAARPAALAATFRAIESFLNAHLYRYSVELKEIDVVESDVPLPQR
ncbi:MAG: hypothetical protein HYV96_00120 [Opitutae bacterium]|nr:hypothetical protein [Opitutae bacterium]